MVYGQDISGPAWPILRDWLGDSSEINDRKKLLEKFYYLIIEALTKDMMSFRKSREKVPYFYQIIDENGGEHDLNGSASMKFQEYDIFRRKSDIKRLVAEEEEWLPTDLLKTAKAVACQALKSGKDFACQWDIQDQDKFPENCVLQRILQVQKLDSYGAEHVYREYQREKNLVGNLSDFSYIHTLMAPDAVLSSIHRYLLATTAKDCSVMLTFRKVLHSWNVGLQKHATIQCPDGQKFLFSIGVIDLEPKPLSCIERHVLRDHEVLKAYISQQAV
ncbi:hypothetical protein J437_LFUL019642 [Ladona fulva]|uniref:Inositol-pentakisphosphate 2-kinase n=1 Tax=Ladona fulva TaxID=123851 RepID=A0A8K0KSJ9_LADFU|nr:hypothetical protein J437_LFUL019642 [Ladona fulva]